MLKLIWIYTGKIISRSVIILYDKLGLRCIWEKFQPPLNNKGERPPSTFALWLTLIWVGLFLAASIRYELALSKLETKVRLATYLAKVEGWKSDITESPSLQNTRIPSPPSIIDPISSIFVIIHPY